jgi:hypothetical protein
VTMPLIPPFGVTASYQNSQYGSGPYYTGGSQVFSHLVNPPSTGVNAETVSNNNAHAAGFTGHGAANEVQSIALGTAVPATGGTFFLVWNDAVTAPIAYNAAAAAVQTALNALPGMTYGINAQELVTITGGPTGGGFTLTFGAQTTASIPYNATAIQVQAAFQALSTVGAGNCLVTGGQGGPYTITFINAKGNSAQGAITSANTFTGGTTPGVTINATLTVGSGPTPNTVVTGGPGPSTPWVVTFGGKLAGINVNPIAADGGALTPAGATVAVTTTTSGEAAFSSTTNPALLNQTRQSDSMRNFYDSGSGNHL